jgi:hypothetical protein
MKPMLIQPQQYQLILSQEQVQFLVDVLGYIGGNAEASRRKVADQLRATMMEAPDVDDKVPHDMKGEGVYCQKGSR